MPTSNISIQEIEKNRVYSQRWSSISFWLLVPTSNITGSIYSWKNMWWVQMSFFHKDFKQDYLSSFLFASTAYIMRQVYAKSVQMSFSIRILREKK